MRKYHKRTGSAARAEFGLELAARLRSCPLTQGLATPVEVLSVQLRAAQDRRRVCEDELLRAGARLCSIEDQSHAAIRAFACAVVVSEHGRLRGPGFLELFPGGIGPRSRGRPQLDRLRAFQQRLEHATSQAGTALRREWSANLQREIVDLMRAIEPHERAHAAVSDAVAAERSLRREHELAVDRVAGQLRALFPGDRARQDWFFPRRNGRNGPPSDVAA